MSGVENRTFSVAAEHAAFIDAKVASGSFASESDVVREGFQALLDRETTLEGWLNREVAAAYDAVRADPSRALPAKDVFDAIRDRHAARRKTRR